MNRLCKKNAFTLSEVLITLGIIGVVAALSIPALMNNIQEAQYKTAYKKAYSILTQTFVRASQEQEIIAFSGTYSSQGGEANYATLKKYFKISKECSSADAGCWNTTGDRWRGEVYWAPAFVDSSGMAWKLRNPDSANLAPAILVDTNGTKKPNQYGKDRFPFYFYSSNAQNVWDSLSTTPIGMPTKIVPDVDILSNTADDVAKTRCPSYVAHPCYFKSWLYD